MPPSSSIFCFLTSPVLAPSLPAAPKNVSFSQPAESAETYDYLEVVVEVDGADASSPFVDATLSGSFGRTGGTGPVRVDGFCDSPDGKVFRIRFMPSSPGDYSSSITYRQSGFEAAHTGEFRASAGHRRGHQERRGADRRPGQRFALRDRS